MIGRENLLTRLYNYINRKEVERSSNAVVLKVKRHLQPDLWSCGIRSTFTILYYYKKLKNIIELKEFESREGTDTPVIEEMLNKYGLVLEQIFNSQMSDLAQAIDAGCPVLTTINDAEHWIVIYGYEKDEHGEVTHLFIADSAFKRIHAKWSIKKFEKMWKEFDEKWFGVVRERDL
jgi:hypothetical protein